MADRMMTTCDLERSMSWPT